MKSRSSKLFLAFSVPVLLLSVVTGTAALAYQSPVAVASADPTSGAWPLTVQFSADGSTGEIVRYWWYFADGYTSTEPNPLHTYNCYGTFPAQLTVTDLSGATSTSTITIKAHQVLFSSSVNLTPLVKYQKSKTMVPISGTVTGAATVKDTEGYLVADAVVQATWATPRGTVSQTATTDASGAAVFSVTVPKGGAGTYTLVVTGISKTDYIYDSRLGSLSASVLIR